MAQAKSSKPVEAEPPPSVAPTIFDKLLIVRGKLRGTALWESFITERQFEAFSIHKLAAEVEAAFNDAGLISEFQVDRWQKSGNASVVEGRLVIVDVATGTERHYATVGEGFDDSDKGFGKAISYARKNAMVCALQLAIGKDNEADSVKSQHQAHQQQAYQQQAYQQHDHAQKVNTPAFVNYYSGEQPQQSPPNGTPPHSYANETFVLHNPPSSPIGVLGGDLLQRVWGIVQSINDQPHIDRFSRENAAEIARMGRMAPDVAHKINQLILAKARTIADRVA